MHVVGNNILIDIDDENGWFTNRGTEFLLKLPDDNLEHTIVNHG